MISVECKIFPNIKKKMILEFLYVMLQLNKEGYLQTISLKKKLYKELSERFGVEKDQPLRQTAIGIMDAICDTINMPFLIKYY